MSGRDPQERDADRVARLLREHDLRVTPQRRAILGSFRGAPEEHLSADEVHSRASARVPEIGRGTVYATLAEFTELGVLASTGTPEPVRYETNVARHDHFRCRLCLRLFDVSLGGDELATRVLPGYTLEAVIVRAEGVCAACNDYHGGLVDGAEAIIRRPTIGADGVSGLGCQRLQNPLGELALAASASGIVRVAFEDHADFPQLLERARSRRGPAAARRHLGALAEALERYFGGEPEPLDANPIDWGLTADASAGALRSVQEVRYAEQRSYDRLDTELAPYECGYALGSNPVPLVVPCHRVGRGGERPMVYVGGPDRLRFLELLEGRMPV